ncbi:MAG: hypothetical protein ABH952_09275 [Candidatus Omnitrophota bacterium]
MKQDDKKNNIIPETLAEQIFSGRCVLFLGAGASAASQLAKELADKYLNGHHREESLAKVASYIEHEHGLGRERLINFIVKKFSNLIIVS